jgi:hypothetical protein
MCELGHTLDASNIQRIINLQKAAPSLLIVEEKKSVNVCFGSKSEVTARHDEVCFTPEIGHGSNLGVHA